MGKERHELLAIIEGWHSDCADIRFSDAGTPMEIIPNSRMMESLKILAKTLRDEHGLTYEEIDSHSISIMIVDTCWDEDVIRKISTADIRRAKKNLSKLWDKVIHNPNFSGIKIATLDESEKVVAVKKETSAPKITPKVEPKVEPKLPDLDPKDRIVMDTSDMADVPFDDEILAELAAVGVSLEEKK